MDAQQGVHFLLMLKQQNKVNLADFEKAVEIAGSKSPSKSFKDAKSYHSMKYLNAAANLGFAKGTRWLAVIRRDEGDEAFQVKVTELRELIL